MEEAVFTLNYLSAVTRHFGEHATAEQLLREALAIAQQNDNVFGASISLNILGQVASLQGDYASAKTLCEQSRQLKQDVGDRWGMKPFASLFGKSSAGAWRTSRGTDAI